MLGVSYDKAAVRRTRKELTDRVRTDWDAVLARRLRRIDLDALSGSVEAGGADGGSRELGTAARATGVGEDADADAKVDATLDDDDDAADLTYPPRDGVEWRERNYASSDASSLASNDSDDPQQSLAQHRAAVAAAAAAESPRRTSLTSITAPARRLFRSHRGDGNGTRGKNVAEGSDADGNNSSSTDSHAREAELSRQRHKQERKRRRRQRLEEEMVWNEGLRDWEATRDIWCRARLVPGALPGSGSPPRPASENTSLSSSATNTTPADEERKHSSEAGEHERSEAKAQAKPQPQPHAQTEEPAQTQTLAQTQTSPPQQQQQQQSQPQPQPLCTTTAADGRGERPTLSLSVVQNTTTQVPIPPPIIPATDPGRTNLEAQYRLIYDKVVLEGLRPQVPINLSHMVRALVKGWQDADEWPPKIGLQARPILSTSNAAAGGANGGKKASRHISHDLAEKGRRLIWGGGGGGGAQGASSPSSPRSMRAEVTNTAAATTAGEEGGTASGQEHAGDREMGSVRRNVAKVAKALRVTRASTPERGA